MPDFITGILYEITFLWPNGDWTWIKKDARDFHEALLLGLLACPDGCRVLRIERMPR